MRGPLPNSEHSLSDLVGVMLQKGHWTFECKNDRVYNARPTRTEQLFDPKVFLSCASLSSAALAIRLSDNSLGTWLKNMPNIPDWQVTKLDP